MTMQRLRWQLGAGLFVVSLACFLLLSGTSRSTSGARADEKPQGAAGEWGNLTGRFVYGGPPPEPKTIDVPNKPEFAVCRKHPIPDQKLVLDADDRGIANVFVYLRRAPKVHPDLAEPPSEPAVLDQKGCTFIPHAQIVRKGQGLLVKSNDPIKHNTRMSPLGNPAFNQIINAEERKGLRVDFVTGERFPFEVKCDLHPWMQAWILVLDHPYGAVSDEHGHFTLEKLPAGVHTFIPWQESTGYLLRQIDVTLQNGQATSRGFLEVEIKPGQTTDLGDIVIPAAKFAG